MIAATNKEIKITWEKLPEDFILPDEPVDNLTQPLLAASLRESLELAGLISPSMLVATNFGLCATVNGKIVVKAPDWVYVPQVKPANRDRRSYTPNLEGDNPLIVLEFLSETEGGEYSVNPNYPYGKWYFYEQILRVSIYGIFHPETGRLELYRLIGDRYKSQIADVRGCYWLEEIRLFLGVWEGTKADRTGYWLRWWNEQGGLLSWGKELVEQERQKVEQESQRAEQESQRAERESQRAERESQRAERESQRAERERQRAERLAQRLQELGVDVEGEEG